MLIWLCRLHESSFDAKEVNALTAVPVNAANVVSKLEEPPQVCTVSVPALGAVQLYHILFIEPPPNVVGSPLWPVAELLEAVKLPLVPVIVVPGNASLAYAGADAPKNRQVASRKSAANTAICRTL